MELRQKTEKAILSTKEIEPIVVRCAWVYGKSFGNTQIAHNIFTGNLDENGNSIIKGDAGKKYAWIHIDDVGEAYQRLVESPSTLVANEIFNLADDTNVSIGEIVEAGRKITNPQKGKIMNVARDTDEWGVLLEQSCRMDCQKLQNATGWYPRHRNMMDNFESHVTSFLLCKQLQQQKQQPQQQNQPHPNDLIAKAEEEAKKRTEDLKSKANEDQANNNQQTKKDNKKK